MEAIEKEPLVSIVTPCLNAAPFIERTILSVLSQSYPRIEYLVMDGGSTDGTQVILERFRERLEFISAGDCGTADAINRGFQKLHGSIFAWLNADDVYCPNAVATAVRHLTAEPETSVVYGDGLWVDGDDAVLGRYPTLSPYDARNFARECFICQPAAFMRSDAFANSGMLDKDLHFAFDYDLWIRLSRGGQFLAIPETLAQSRMHRHNKSLGQRRLVFQEGMAVLRRHFGYIPVQWIYGYLSWLRDGRDQFFQPIHHSAAVYLASLAVGTYHNPLRIGKYWREWASGIRRAYGF